MLYEKSTVMIKYLDFNSKCAMATYFPRIRLRGAEAKRFENHPVSSNMNATIIVSGRGGVGKNILICFMLKRGNRNVANILTLRLCFTSLSMHVILYKCRNHCELSISWVSLCFIYLYFSSTKHYNQHFQVSIPASTGRQLQFGRQGQVTYDL